MFEQNTRRGISSGCCVAVFCLESSCPLFSNNTKCLCQSTGRMEITKRHSNKFLSRVSGLMAASAAQTHTTNPACVDTTQHFTPRRRRVTVKI